MKQGMKTFISANAVIWTVGSVCTPLHHIVALFVRDASIGSRVSTSITINRSQSIPGGRGWTSDLHARCTNYAFRIHNPALGRTLFGWSALPNSSSLHNAKAKTSWQARVWDSLVTFLNYDYVTLSEVFRQTVSCHSSNEQLNVRSRSGLFHGFDKNCDLAGIYRDRRALSLF